jgi:hypothetical protein
MTFSKRGILVAAMVVGSSLAVPGAYASDVTSDIASDFAGCTTVFAGSASNPSSDAGPVLVFNPKAILQGIHIYPAEGIEVVGDYANHELNATAAYLVCVL